MPEQFSRMVQTQVLFFLYLDLSAKIYSNENVLENSIKGTMMFLQLKFDNFLLQSGVTSSK